MLVAVALRRRKLVLLVTVVLTVSLGLASSLLKLNMRWSDLLPRSLPEVQEFEKIDNNYLQAGNMIVAVHGPAGPGLERLTDEVTAVLQEQIVCPAEVESAECIEQGLYGRYVYGSLPVDWLTEHGLRLLDERDAERMADLLADPRLLPYLVHLNDDLEREYVGDQEAVRDDEREVVASLDALEQLVGVLGDASRGEVTEASVSRLVRDLTVGRPTFTSLDGGMNLVMVASSVPADDWEHQPLLDMQIEEALMPLVEANPDYRIERTGITAIGRDELDSVGPQTQLITALAFVIIFVLLVWNFRSVITPVFAVAPIVLGIEWTMGLVALTIGSLNTITVMIMVVLMGLGIDFTIHIATRYHEEVARGRSIEEALRATIAGTGVGVITGAVTTAIAFLVLMTADTKGISEFGYCAGTGVLMTLAATLWVLPSLLAWWTERAERKGKVFGKTHDFSGLGRFASAMGRLRWGVLAVVLAATSFGLWAGRHLEWEWNFMELEAEGLRSVELQDEIIDRFGLSVTVSMLTAPSVAASRELRDQFEDEPLVGEVDDISQWTSPDDFEASRPHLSRLREEAGLTRAPLSYAGSEVPTSAAPPDDPFAAVGVPERRERLTDELDRLWANLVEIQALAIIGGQDRVVTKLQRLIARRETRDQGPLLQLVGHFSDADDAAWAHLERFAAAFDDAMRTQVGAMAAGDGPVTLEDVPPDILARYQSYSADGYLMQIMPEHNLYERDELEPFEQMAERISPNVTGLPQMMLRMNTETIREGKTALLLAVVVILVVLLVDFGRPLLALIAMLPLLSGTALMLLTMWLMDVRLHYINMIAFPLIIGIGVDNGVHFLHRFLQEGPGGMQRAVTSVGRAILMTSLTTMIGFGSLMLYLMRGMASLGMVLFIGVGACFVVTITLLPALATILESRILKASPRRGREHATTSTEELRESTR